jgi:hypothetical protein
MNLPPILPYSPSPDPPAGQSESSRANRLLAQLIVLATLLASAWILLVSTFTGSAGSVANNAAITFGLIYPFHIPLTGLAIWTWIKRSPSPRLAILVIAIPWVTLPAPFLLNRLNPTGPLLDSPEKLINTSLGLVGVALVGILLRPRKCACLLPALVLKSSALNLLILLAVISLYLMPIVFLPFNGGGATTSRNHPS